MAYQHLFGSASNSTMGAGYCTLASTPEFYNVMTDEELSNNNQYSFDASGIYPIKFYHYYHKYKYRFIQSAISFEYDYVGRNSSIAHSLLLSEEESNRIINENIQPVVKSAFLNGENAEFKRPEGDVLPALEYPMIPVKEDSDILDKVFNGNIEEMKKFIFALLTLPNNGYSIFMSLPYEATEASFVAVEFMNRIIPCLPAEYKKQIGYITYKTDTIVYEDFNIYFTSNIDLSREYISEGYVFDFAGSSRYIGGIDEYAYDEYQEMITVLCNQIANNEGSLNSYYNSILPKIDQYERFDLIKLNEVYFMWKFLENADAMEREGDCASILSSFYSCYNIVDNKDEFNSKVEEFWNREIQKSRQLEYSPSIDVYRVVERSYNNLSPEHKASVIKKWYYIIYNLTINKNYEFIDSIFRNRYENSDFKNSLFGVTVEVYARNYFIEKSRNGVETISQFICHYINLIQSAEPGYRSLFQAIRDVMSISRKFFENNSDFLTFVIEGIISPHNDTIANYAEYCNLQELLALSKTMKEEIYVGAGNSPVGLNIYEHLYNNHVIRRISEKLTYDEITRVVDNKEIIELYSDFVEELPNLKENSVANLLVKFRDISSRSNSIGIINDLKPLSSGDRDYIKSWIKKSGKANESIYHAMFANADIIGDDGMGYSPAFVGNTGGSMPSVGMASVNSGYDIDFYSAIKDYNKGRDPEACLDSVKALVGIVEELRQLDNDRCNSEMHEYIDELIADPSLDKRVSKEIAATVKKDELLKNIMSSGASKKAPAGEKKSIFPPFGKSKK